MKTSSGLLASLALLASSPLAATDTSPTPETTEAPAPAREHGVVQAVADFKACSADNHLVVFRTVVQVTGSINQQDGDDTIKKVAEIGQTLQDKFEAAVADFSFQRGMRKDDIENEQSPLNAFLQSDLPEQRRAFEEAVKAIITDAEITHNFTPVSVGMSREPAEICGGNPLDPATFV